MNYNTEISNSEPLPIPYIEEVTKADLTRTVARSLYHGRPIMLNVKAITVNVTCQIVVEDKDPTVKYIFAAEPGLSIVPNL